MSLMSDLKSPRTEVGRWARDRFPEVRRLYPLWREAPEPLIRPNGWGDGTDQRWSWAGTAVGHLLNWQLGNRASSDAVIAGVATAAEGRIVLTDDDDPDWLRETALGGLVSTVADPDDLDVAARVAVLWALVEQHARYALTENLLTGCGWDATEDDLLGRCPDDVVDDVASIGRLTQDRLVDRITGLGPIRFGPVYRYPGGADADLVAGSALLEVKTTVRLRPKLAAVLQPVLYALLDDHDPDAVGWVLPRSGALITVGLDESLAAAGCADEVSTLRDEFRELTDPR